LKKILISVCALILTLNLAGCTQKVERPAPEAARIGVMVGSTNEAFAENNFPNAKIEKFNNYVDSSAALKSNKLDYAMMDYLMALNFTRYNKDLEVLPQKLTDEKLCIVTNKNNPELTKKVNEIVDKYISDGTIDDIADRWLKEDGSAYEPVDIAEVENGPILKAAIITSREPLAFMMDGKPAGTDVEIIRRIAYELGMKVEFQDMEFASVIVSLQTGKADIAMGMYNTPERAEKVNLSNPYLSDPQVFLVKKHVDNSGVFTGVGSLLSNAVDGFKNSFERTFIVENRYKLVLEGLSTTIYISIFSMLFGTIFGALICAMRRAKNKLLQVVSIVYMRIIQGTPMVVILMILYYVVFGSVDINAAFVAVLGFSLNFAAYTSEMFRTSIDSVDKGQLEAASASGFSKLQTFIQITLPQSARSIIPVYKGEFIAMVKMTSVVGYIAIQDLTKMSDIIRSRTYEAFFPLIATAVIYFTITYVFILLLNVVELKIDPKRRKRIIKGVNAK